MGTEVDYKNTFQEYYSMRNYNEDSNNSSWHLINMLTNGHDYDGFTPADAYLGHDTDKLKQKMLQHEAIFKNQVHELHRLYTRQRDMMEEVIKREFYKYQNPIDTSSSSSQKLYDKWQNSSLPLGNSKSRPLIFGAEISNSPLSCSKENSVKDCEIVEHRATKVRKKLFDLQLGAHEYEGEQIVDNHGSEISSFNKENGFIPENGLKMFLGDGGKKHGYKNGQQFMQSNGLADLNEPVYVQESDGLTEVNFLGPSVKQVGLNRSSSCLRKPGNNTMQHFYGKEVQHQGIYSKIYSKSQDNSHFNQNPLLISTSNGHPFINSSNTGNCWSPSGQSWVKSNDNLTRKLTSFQTYPSFLTDPKSHTDKFHRNGNGFYNGSLSGSKELPGRLPSYRNCNKINDGSQKIFKGSNFIDLTDTTKDLMDLNTVQTLSNEDENPRKCDQTVKSKPDISKNGDNLDNNNNRKLLGIPIFGKFCASKTDVFSSAVSRCASTEHRGFDINVAWDDVDEICNEKMEETDAEIKNFKNYFDLNSCATEADDMLITESVKSPKKMSIEIDLEEPAVEEETEPKPNHLENEKLAAQAIVEISSQQVEEDDPLLWFVDIICETDEFEMLTLQLEESKEEDYMPPTQLVPDFEEVGPTTTSPPVSPVTGLDERRLTGWGKTTPRQRCALVNFVKR